MNSTLSIIIPSFNTKKILHECLLSLFRQTKKINFEVIVIDNASSDESCQMVKEKFPQVRLVINRENLGYAKASNQGLNLSKGKYILFLNSDTIILERAVEKAIEFMDKNSKIDILGCQLLYKDRTIQASGGFSPQLLRMISMMFFIDDLPLLGKLIKPYHQTRRNFYRKQQQLDWVTGAFLLVKRKVTEEIGGFDERFFMYSEEVDFCYRANKAGFKVCFYPGAKIVHLKSKSSTDGFKEAVLAEYQGLMKFYQKHKPKWQRLVLRLSLKTGACLRIFVFGILKQDKNKKEIYEKAFKLV